MIANFRDRGERMARIGIMTFLHNDNYGSILQAWALQNAVRSLGYDAEHIDYVPSQTEKMKNLLCSGNSPRLILDGMKKRSAARGLNEGFDEFRQTQMILSPICRDQSALAHQALSYDALICGSDQIWSPTWLNPAYFLNFTKKPKVAYAPSLGVSTMTDSAKGRKIAALIRGFAAISVREEEGAALLQALIGKKPAVMPDPVMLLPREKWLELIGRLGKIEWVEKFLHIKKEKIEKFVDKFSRFGDWFVFFSFVPFVGDVIAVAAGFFRGRWWVVAIAMLLGKFVRYVIWMYANGVVM